MLVSSIQASLGFCRAGKLPPVLVPGAASAIKQNTRDFADDCGHRQTPILVARVNSAVQELLKVGWGITMMSLVRLLGFTTLGCGCVTGHYREVATNREITYVEEKGAACSQHAHRRNHTLTPARAAVYSLSAKAS